MNRSCLLLFSVVFAACGASTPPKDVTELRFAIVAGATPVACGTPVVALGTTQSAWKPADLRFYVSNLTLAKADGTTAAFQLDDDAFQREGVAMLDFEDGTGDCANGTPQTHRVVTGHAPAGAWTTLRFTLGVPFDQNHQDATTAQAPLNSSAMFWNWEFGYKFAKIEGLTTGGPGVYLLHLGSTGCVAGATPNSIVSCEQPNAPTVSLTGFDPATSTVALDVETLFAESDITTNFGQSAPGCMSEPDDTDCAPIFRRLGLPFGNGAATPQQVFRLTR